MNKLFLFITIGLLYFPTLSFSQAATQTEVQASTSAAESTTSSLSQLPSLTRVTFGLGYNHFDYAEELPAPHKSTEVGNLPFFTLGVRSPLQENLFFLGNLDLTFAKTTYDGTSQSGSTRVITETENKIVDVDAELESALLGVDQPLSLFGHTGLGFHVWNRGGDAHEVQGVWTYREKYTWIYWPVGLRLAVQPSNRFSISLDTTAKLMFGGRVVAYYSELDSRMDNPSLDLGSRLGYRAQLTFDVRIADSVSLAFGPFFEHSEIGESNLQELTAFGGYGHSGVYVQEPSSRTSQYGATTRVGIYF